MTIEVSANKWPYKVKEPLDPNAVLDYCIDWTDWVPEGSGIDTATWTVVGGTKVNSVVIHQIPDPSDLTGLTMLDVEQTIVWLSVTSGSTEVQATVHVVLNTSPVALEDDRTLIFKVMER